jgi:hypothetical protein
MKNPLQVPRRQLGVVDLLLMTRCLVFPLGLPRQSQDEALVLHVEQDESILGVLHPPVRRLLSGHLPQVIVTPESPQEIHTRTSPSGPHAIRIHLQTGRLHLGGRFPLQASVALIASMGADVADTRDLELDLGPNLQ